MLASFSDRIIHIRPYFLFYQHFLQIEAVMLSNVEIPYSFTVSSHPPRTLVLVLERSGLTVLLQVVQQGLMTLSEQTAN